MKIAAPKSGKNDPAVVRKCDCKHAQQDAMYGAGMRVHNPSSAKSGQGREKLVEHRCTVCRDAKPAVPR